MEFTLNQLNEKWVESGNKVADLNAKMQNALNDDNFSQEEFEHLKINMILKKFVVMLGMNK